MIVYFILFLTVIPFMIGTVISLNVKKDYSNSCMYRYIVGIMALLALFQMICIPCTFFQVKFHVLGWIYSGTVIILTLAAFWRIGVLKNGFAAKRKTQLKIKCKISGFEWLAAVLIMLQIFNSVIKTPEYIYSGDDAAYITMAGDAIGNDTIYLTDYMTGQTCSLVDVSPKYTLTSYNMFTAYLAKISGLHILILCKTILPIFILLIAYMVYAMLGKMLFANDGRKVGIFLTLLSILNICSGFSNYTLTFRLLVCNWQGKAIFAAVILPFLFYQMFQMQEECDMYMEYVIVFIGILAATSATLMGVGLAPILVMVIALIHSLKKRDLESVMKAGVCCVPCGIYLVIYILYDKILTMCNLVGLW